ncbi:MAG: matrixin family metalloprotease [Capsulimonadales bacterium]|nr:matrixin family metalloprotease [Capsulimonadales bacterium]
MFRFGLIFVSLLLLLSVSGCGGGNNNDFPLPPSFSESRFQPNYGGDLDTVNYYTQPNITYRIMESDKATDIRLNRITAVNATDAQKQAIREAITKWQTALAGNDPPHQRTFVEVGNDVLADIDFVIQTRDQFRSTFFTEEFAYTEYYIRDIDRQFMGRAVVRLRNDLGDSNFRYVTLHETGHALGLVGHSRRLGTVMYPYQTPFSTISDLTDRDINTIRATYTRE